LTEKGLEHEVAHYGVTALLTRVQEPLRQALVRATTFEVTTPVRVLFTYSGLGRQTFKRLTGLEVRLFMRHDAKVFISLGNTVVGTAASRFINDLRDKIADDVVEATRPAEQLRAWRQSVAAWWLLNAGGPGDNDSAAKSKD
jgi:hypothetical protein